MLILRNGAREEGKPGNLCLQRRASPHSVRCDAQARQRSIFLHLAPDPFAAAAFLRFPARRRRRTIALPSCKLPLPCPAWPSVATLPLCLSLPACDLPSLSIALLCRETPSLTGRPACLRPSVVLRFSNGF